MKKTINLYRVPIRIVLSLAIMFLCVSIFVWVSLCFYALFGESAKFLINEKNSDSFYQVGVIATTVTFGLFTIQFSLRSFQNSFSDKQNRILSHTTDLLNRYMDFVSSPDFLFTSLVCRELVERFQLEKVFDNFENIQEDFVKICLNSISNSNLDFGNEIIEIIKTYMSTSTKSGNCPDWFIKAKTKNYNDDLYDYFLSRFIFASNWFDSASYQYLNEYVDEEAFEGQIIYDVRFIFLMDLIFSSLSMTHNECKSISYQAIKKYKEKNDKIEREKERKKKKNGAKD